MGRERERENEIVGLDSNINSHDVDCLFDMGNCILGSEIETEDKDGNTPQKNKYLRDFIYLFVYSFVICLFGEYPAFLDREWPSIFRLDGELSLSCIC